MQSSPESGRMGRAHLAHVGGGELLGCGSQVSGISIVAGNAHFGGSWVPIDQHPVSRAEGCGPQVEELGLHGTGWSREPSNLPSLLYSLRVP